MLMWEMPGEIQDSGPVNQWVRHTDNRHAGPDVVLCFFLSLFIFSRFFGGEIHIT